MFRQLFLLSTVTLAGALSGRADVLTLEQAVSLALTNNRALHVSAIDVEKARDRVSATRTRQLPNISLYLLGAQQLRSFDFTLERGVLGSYEGTGPLPAQDVSLTTPLQPTGIMIGRVTQPLTSLIRIRRNIAALETNVRLTDEEARAERQKLARDVRRVYYGLQQVEASLRSVRQTADLYEEIEELTSKYVLQQVALKVDLLQTQARRARTQQLETDLRNQQALTRVLVRCVTLQSGLPRIG